MERGGIGKSRADFAMFSKKPKHKGMLLMVSPQDGRVQAIVEVCQKRKIG